MRILKALVLLVRTLPFGHSDAVSAGNHEVLLAWHSVVDLSLYHHVSALVERFVVLLHVHLGVHTWVTFLRCSLLV